MRPFILILFLTTISSCFTAKRELIDLLEPTDKIRLIRFTPTDTLTYDITDKRDIEIFREIISGKQDEIPNTEKIGEIVYLTGEKTIIKVDVLTDGIKYVFNKKSYQEKITYRAGMYFSEVWSSQRQ